MSTFTREGGLTRVGAGACSGSFGELLQGVLPGNMKFLVNLKIKHRSQVSISLSPCQYFAEKEARYAESYKRYSKSYKLVRNLLSDLECHDDYFLEVDSDIPIGKGLSSSTADMVATLRALEKALSISLKADYVSRILTEIEPNDGLHYSGTSAYHHTMGRLIANYDFIPPLHILGLDLGGVIDTVAFNAVPRVWSDVETAYYQILLQQMDEALKSRDVAEICRISTESAKIWQKINPKNGLENLIELAQKTGALGILNTHSGSYLGFLYPQTCDSRDRSKILEQVKQFTGLDQIAWFETLGVPDQG